MLPGVLNSSKENGLSYFKSFNETLCEGYQFEVKNDVVCSGSRSLFYCKEEHSLLISHFFSSRVHVINLDTGRLRWFNHHGTTVRSVQVSNHEIITTSWDGTVCITGFENLERRKVFTERTMGRCPYAAISPDKESLFSFSYDSDKNPHLASNTVREWSLINGRLNRTYHLSGAHLAPDGRFGTCKVFDNRLFVVSDTGHFYIYNSITGALLSENIYYDQLQSLCLFPHFNQLIIGSGDGNLYVHDMNGGRMPGKRRAHRYSIPQLLVHPEKPDIMISISFDGTMKLWKLPELELLESVYVSGYRLWNVTAVNDLLITGGDEEITCVYDIKNLPEIIFKGKLIVTDESFAFIPANSRIFFTNNQSIMQVRRDSDCALLEGQLADYMLNTACNIKALRDLFSAENQDRTISGIPGKGFYQLTR